jgi:predicted nuclease of restriction endonuclease-like (RecB) superfamily
MSLLKPDYINTLNELKEKIRQARIRASVSVNTEMLKLYWEIGHTILTQQQQEGWGAKVIDKLAADLKIEFPDFKGLSVRNLKYMRRFAEAYPEFMQPAVSKLQSDQAQAVPIVQAPLAQLQEIGQAAIAQTMLAQLSWYHHITLLDKIKDPSTRLFYIQETVRGGWSRDVMVHQIESDLHQRQGKITSNFKNTIAPEQSELVQQLFKDPYKFEFIYLGKEAKERDLEDALTGQLTKFLLELGQHFAFMGRQYKLALGDKEYFFDLLFYHTRLKRYIVIDLKIDEFKPEYKGKMEFYLNLADDYLRNMGDEASIGLILCKTKDGLVAEYALRDSSKPIGIAEYTLANKLPNDIRGELPTVEELEAQMEREYEELKTPAQKRFESLKEKLAELKKEEIKQIATIPILYEIFDKSLMPLFQSLLKRMEDFRDLFVSRSYYWQGKNKSITDIHELATDWEDEEFLKSRTEFYFSYRLHGLKKAGTESFDTGIQLNYRVDTYWYGFILVNYNNQQPFVKKLYHEQLSDEDIGLIIEAVYNSIVENIEWQIERLKPKTNE